MTTIGDFRTFFLESAWRLPDLSLVIAGPFWKSRLVSMADRSQHSAFALRLTKHLSKLYLFQQREAGYRPPALKRNANPSGGRAEPSVSVRSTQEEALSFRSPAIVGGGMKMVRRRVASRSPPEATDRGAGGDRRSTGNSAWDSRKRRHASGAERRRLPPRQAGFRRLALVTS